MYLRLSPYREVLQGVLASLQVNEGIIKITGKSGAGKTALCNQLFHELEGSGQPAVFFLKPPASAIALQNDILDNLKLDPTGNFTRTLTGYLLARTAAQVPLVLVFDDAQHFDPQTFSAVRMLCNIQDKSRALIRVILCGNEELDAKLEGPALRAITQFLNQSFALPYLTQEQVHDFCQGYWQQMNEDMKPLGERSLQKLFQETRGHPGILHARLSQGTTGAEKSDRHRGTDDARSQPPPLKYSGRRAGWVPAFLILAGLMLLAGAGAWYLLTTPAERGVAREDAAPPLADEPVVAVESSPPLPQTIAAAAPESESESESESAAVEPDDAAAVAAPVAATEPEPTEPAPVVAANTAANTAAPTPASAEAGAEAVASDAALPQPQSEAVVTPDLAELPEATAPPAQSLPPVAQFLSEWTVSWQNQDVDAYLAHYHQDFAPAQGLTQEAWREQRRRVIANAADIVIGFDEPEVVSEAPDGTRVLRFWLNYSADDYADRTLKELLLVPVDGMWRIRAETNLRTERL